MSLNTNDERIKLSVKSSNYNIATKFASTENDVSLLFVANNCKLYNWNNYTTGAEIGAKLIDIDTNNEHHF